jgi:deoxyribonuclease V
VRENYSLVAGVNVAYSNDYAYGACVIMDQDYNVIESSESCTRLAFPYIPGFFSYRELEPALNAVKRISKFDVLLVNGHGIAHPRKLGLASHLGLILNKPTIGIAKNLLIGEIENVFGKERVLFNREIVGEKTITSTGSPIYVSIGHMISLETSVKTVKNYLTDNRLPEPLNKAHIIAQENKFTEKTNINVI